MRIPIRFTYKVYPNSPKATKLSAVLGGLTCTAMSAVFALFWYGFVSILLGASGVEDETTAVISLASLSVFFILRAYIRKKLEAKIDAIAMRDMNANFFNGIR